MKTASKLPEGFLVTLLSLVGAGCFVGCTTDTGSGSQIQTSSPELGSEVVIEVPKAFEPEDEVDVAEELFSLEEKPLLDDMDLADVFSEEEEPEVGLVDEMEELGLEEDPMAKVTMDEEDPMERAFNQQYELPQVGIQNIDKDVMERLGFPPVLPVLDFEDVP